MKTPCSNLNSIFTFAECDISAYKGYSYFHQACTIKEVREQKRLTLPKYIPVEWLYRAGRFIAFADATEMEPYNWNSKDPAAYNQLVGTFYTLQGIGFLDHSSYLQDDDGTPYCLFEPYQYPGDWEARLLEAGMVGIIVPKSIAPYHDSNRWPQAASFLVTPIFRLNEMRFSTIKAKLREAGSLYV